MGEYTHLSDTDRRRIDAYLEMGLGVSEIAKKINRHRSTLYREINRNKEPEGYYSGLAGAKAQARTKQKCPGKLQTNRVLRHYVIDSLKKGWSPEQISGRMKYKKAIFYACPETIYQFIYQSGDKKLYQLLAYKRPKRRKRYGRKEQLCRYGEARLITQRPKDISTRKYFGHWEGDTIAFSSSKEKAVTTLVERKSRIVYLIKNDRKFSYGVMRKIKEKFATLPEKMFKTITFDQGMEFADYKQLEKDNTRKVYFCETHSPWQKGSNENMNGRLRRYLPREANIAKITQADLDRLAAKMNQCPRKCLGYKTPQELFIQQHKNDCRT